MKRTLHILALILSFSLSLAFFHISWRLPSDSSSLVEKKYNSWTGVLRGWICSNWRCEGSFVTWLNRCATAFEKEHPGVYIEFTTVTDASLREIADSSLRAPELLFFSPGTLHAPSILETVQDDSQTRIRFGNAIPVCMGGYSWVVNTALCETIPDTLIHLPDNPGQCFSRAAGGLAGACKEIELPDPGIDLGLTAASAVKPSLDTFINGELPAIVISQYELSKLIRLRDSGSGPEWRCIPSGTYMYADQLLLGGVVSQSDESASVRTPLAQSFLHFLLTDECQRLLTVIGAFPSTTITVYPATSPYSTMEGMFHSLPLTVPELF